MASSSRASGRVDASRRVRRGRRPGTGSEGTRLLYEVRRDRRPVPVWLGPAVRDPRRIRAQLHHRGPRHQAVSWRLGGDQHLRTRRQGLGEDLDLSAVLRPNHQRDALQQRAAVAWQPIRYVGR